MTISSQKETNLNAYNRLCDGTHEVGFGFTDYQKETLERMKTIPCFAIFFEQGLGKTLTALSDFVADEETDTMVVLHAPAIIRSRWVDDIKKYGYDFDVFVWNGKTTKEKREEFAYAMSSKRKTVFLFNIDIMNKSTIGFAYISDVVKKRKNISLCIDQSQAIKSPKAKRTKLAVSMGKYPTIKKKRILEGAPNEEGNHEFYTQFEFLSPEIIGCFNHFQFTHMYCKTQKQTLFINGLRREINKIVGNKDEAKLMEKIAPFTAWKKRETSDVVYKDISIYLSAEEKKLWKDLVLQKELGVTSSELAQVKEEYEINDDSLVYAIVLQQKLHQISAGVFTKTKSKTDALISLLESEIPSKKQVIVFCSYKKEVENIHHEMQKKKMDCCMVHGGVKDSGEIVKKFQDGEIRIIVATHKTIGVGLDLFNAHYVIFHSLVYSLRTRIECIRRVDRLGQKFTPIVYDLIAKYDDDKVSVDKEILNKLGDKKTISDFSFDMYQQIINEEY